MTYSPGVSAFQRNTLMGGLYNNGLSYYSGSDPASFFPFVVADLLGKQVPPDYVYRTTTEDRLSLPASQYRSDTPVSQWTPEQQTIYGKIFGTPSGPPSPGRSDAQIQADILAGNTNIYGQPLPEATDKSVPAIPSSSGGIFSNPIGTGIGTGIVNTASQWGVNLIVIVVAITLLGVAAYSIIIPKETRGALLKSAIAG